MHKSKIFIPLGLAIVLNAAFLENAAGHDILGGSLGAQPNRVDVYRTTCFSWGDGVHPVANAPEVNGNADRFRFAISLTRGTTVTATVGFTPTGNVNGNATGNNVLPAAPGAKFLSVTDNKLGTAWDANATSPEFSSTAPYSAPPPFGKAVSLIPGGDADGEYVIVVSHNSTVPTKYDFVAHCQNGVATSGHTGQGLDFSGAAPNMAPTFDYDQVIDR